MVFSILACHLHEIDIASADDLSSFVLENGVSPLMRVKLSIVDADRMVISVLAIVCMTELRSMVTMCVLSTVCVLAAVCVLATVCVLFATVSMATVRVLTIDEVGMLSAVGVATLMSVTSTIVFAAHVVRCRSVMLFVSGGVMLFMSGSVMLFVGGSVMLFVGMDVVLFMSGSVMLFVGGSVMLFMTVSSGIVGRVNEVNVMGGVLRLKCRGFEAMLVPSHISRLVLTLLIASVVS